MNLNYWSHGVDFCKESEFAYKFKSEDTLKI